MLHIVPDERGRWLVYEDASRVPISEHTSATSAELAARRHARPGTAIVLHDRYGRVHDRRLPPEQLLARVRARDRVPGAPAADLLASERAEA